MKFCELKLKIIIISILMGMLIPSYVNSKNLHPESYYQGKWCSDNRGIEEYTLPDLTRCDCITDTHAVEIEFGAKWAEGIGQSLYYSIQTGNRAGIALILEKDKDYKYWIRLNTVIDKYNLPIDAWIISP